MSKQVYDGWMISLYIVFFTLCLRHVSKYEIPGLPMMNR